VSDNPVSEKGARPLARTIDKLIGYHDITGGDLFPQAPNGTDRDDLLDPQFFQAEQVGAKVQLSWKESMAFPVAGQKNKIHTVHAPHEEWIRRLPEGSFHLHLSDPLQTLHLV
jgi:hypothetical protein